MMRRRKPPSTIRPSFIRRQAVAGALRIVEFLLPRLHVDGGVGHLAKSISGRVTLSPRTVLCTGMLLNISVGSPSA